MQSWQRGILRLVASVLVAAALSACNEAETVDLVFRPTPGDRLAYDIAVRSTVTTELGGPATTRTEEVVLRVEQDVRSVGRNRTVRMTTSVARIGERPLVFDLRLDPVRGDAVIDAVGGLSSEILGELGPSRLLLLASGLLPGERLHPGQMWEIERRVELPDGAERFTGRGRLTELRSGSQRSIARVRADTELPVTRRLTLPEGRVHLRGTERTTAGIDYDVADGTMVEARSASRGTFRIRVRPPTGDSEPVTGTLDVLVEAQTTRVRRAG